VDLAGRLGMVFDRRVGTVVAGRQLHNTLAALVWVGSTDPIDLPACMYLISLAKAGTPRYNPYKPLIPLPL